MSEEKTLDEVYRDRNLLAVALAETVRRYSAEYPGSDRFAAGWSEPDADDADAGEWAIVWARLDHDQVSWHVPRDLAEQSALPRRPHDWDGHTREEKNSRLEGYIN